MKNLGQNSIIQNTQQTKGAKKKGTNKEDPSFVKAFFFGKKTHPHLDFNTTCRLQSTYHKRRKIEFGTLGNN
jgi:hypothetical protein